ncbi:MAG: alfa-L-rhamnosidase, partial [Roseburia sp.]|nr:alfa-L-rhamnosidase [Roseburia sp.]
DGAHTYKPHLTFYGFRYLRVNEFPGGAATVKPENFTAIAVHSNLRRIGSLNTSSPLLNRLFENIIWGQKCNFLDVPTDCPQRDERLGWTGDAQVFVRTACLNFDVEKFFTKWLADMAADQHADGYVGHIIPDLLQAATASAAWGDAAAICPWEVYMAYGNPAILENQFACMKGWVDYITSTTKDANLWTGGSHYGDWLGLDAPSGSYKGSSREEFIVSAYYAYSTSLVVKAGKVLGKDVSFYETLYENIVDTFRKTYTEYKTQTECVLAVHFHLAKDCQAASDQLADMVRNCGVKLQTGFVGTPYLLHALSDYGHADLAYSLLLREQYPSWLYPVTKGATTIWEHWDGIMENGDFWSSDMNSYNHYAYGAVADWMYGVAAGIKPLEEAPGYAKVSIAPIPDTRLGWFGASLDTRHGKISSKWTKETDRFRYDITTPVEAVVTIAGETQTVPAGSYVFYSKFE